MVETDAHPLQGWFLVLFGLWRGYCSQSVLDWSPPVHIVQSRSLTREQKDPVFCSRWRSSLYPNCITPSSIISWVKPALPFHSYTARTKKVRWKETWIKRDLRDILANHVLSFGS